MSHTAELIAVGTELLLGNIANTDAQMISEGLSQLGINVYYHTVVGDNPQRVRQAVEIARQRADILITTGGLGPTCDDLTKVAIAQAVGVDQKSVYAYALGEHGESQMVPWSIVTIAGKPLSQLMEERPDTYGKLDLDALAAEGKKGGWIILGGKGSTEFGIGASIAEVIRAVFGDENRVLPVSVYLDGQYGQHGVYASVPAVLNRNGVADIIELKLTEAEQKEFDASCQTMIENFNLALTL